MKFYLRCAHRFLCTILCCQMVSYIMNAIEMLEMREAWGRYELVIHNIILLSEIKYLVWEGEGVWSQLEVVCWEMSWEELSHQRWERSEGMNLDRWIVVGPGLELLMLRCVYSKLKFTHLIVHLSLLIVVSSVQTVEEEGER